MITVHKLEPDEEVLRRDHVTIDHVTIDHVTIDHATIDHVTIDHVTTSSSRTRRCSGETT